MPVPGPIISKGSPFWGNANDEGSNRILVEMASSHLYKSMNNCEIYFEANP